MPPVARCVVADSRLVKLEAGANQVRSSPADAFPPDLTDHSLGTDDENAPLLVLLIKRLSMPDTAVPEDT